MADHLRLGGSLRCVGELVDDVPMYEEPLRGDAHLTAVPILADDPGGGDRLDVSIGKHQHGGVAAEFQ